MLTPEVREELELIRAQAGRVARQARLLKVMAARLLDSAAAEDRQPEEAHDDPDRSS